MKVWVTTVLATVLWMTAAPSAPAATVAMQRDDCRIDAACSGVRPGAVVHTQQGARAGSIGVGCTMNFVFKGSDGDTFVGTAGHCQSPDQGQMVWPAGEGPPAFDGSAQRIGEYAYKSLSGLDTDFALIRLDDGIRWDAEACEIGGPTGINSKTTSQTVQLLHFGQGAVVAEGGKPLNPPLPARTAVANGMPWRDKIFAFGTAAHGDSGSPVVDKAGRAIGIVSAGGALVLPPDNSHKGTMAIMRLRAELLRAQKALGLKLKLQRSDR